ncbi:MAG: signal peptidase II [Georgfuchsia sp.]
MPRFIGWLLLAALVVVLDQVSKAWVTIAIPLNGGFALSDYFNLVFIFNRGAAFSFLSGADGWQRWFFFLLAVGISLWLALMIRRHAAERLQPAALALILGGAIGNAVDRIIHGAVVDFLDFHYAGWHFWAFNVADSAISVGVALLLLHQLMHKEAKHD